MSATATKAALDGLETLLADTLAVVGDPKAYGFPVEDEQHPFCQIVADARKVIAETKALLDTSGCEAYIAAAGDSDDFAVDEPTMVSRSDAGGVWVEGWRYVSPETAGVPSWNGVEQEEEEADGEA